MFQVLFYRNFHFQVTLCDSKLDLPHGTIVLYHNVLVHIITVRPHQKHQEKCQESVLGKFLSESVDPVYRQLELRKIHDKEITNWFNEQIFYRKHKTNLWVDIHGKNTDQNKNSCLGGSIRIVIILVRLYITENNLVNIDKNVNSINKTTVTQRCPQTFL